MRRIIFIVIFFTVGSLASLAQTVAIKTNLAYGGYAMTPNLGFEFGVGSRSTLELTGAFNWFQPKEGSDKKRIHWLGQLEYRYWLCRKFSGHFLGAHLLAAQYNIAGHEMPLLLGSGSNQYRYEGWAVGVGISYGYQFYLGKRWNLELSVGAGYARLSYDQFRCGNCGDRVGSKVRHYLGPTKASLSLIYIIK